LWTAFLDFASSHEPIEKLDEYAACCIEQLPDFYDGYLTRAVLRENRQDHAGALQDVSKALALQPGCVDAIAVKYEILVNLNRNSEALKCAKQLVMFDPGNWINKRKCATVLMTMGDFFGALHYINEILEQIPDEPVLLVDRANCFWMSGRIEEAMADYDMAEIAFRSEGLTESCLLALAGISMNRGEIIKHLGYTRQGNDMQAQASSLGELVKAGICLHRSN